MSEYGTLKTMLGRPLGALPYAAATTGVGAGLGWLASKGVNWMHGDPKTEEEAQEAKKRTRNWMLLGGLGGLGVAAPDLYGAYDQSRRKAQPEVAALRDRYNSPEVDTSAGRTQLLADRTRAMAADPQQYGVGGNMSRPPSYNFSSGFANPSEFFKGYPSAPAPAPATAPVAIPDGTKAGGAWDVRSFELGEGQKTEIGYHHIPELSASSMDKRLPLGTASRMLGYDPDLSPTDRVKFQNMLDDAKDRKEFSVGDLVQVGLSAGLGYGAAYGLGQVMHGLFGTSDKLTTNMARAGAIGGALRALKVV